MINFFRKIRKKMADDNRPLKYLRYAIGEILLVVIGILLALQINTWNQERLAGIEEKNIMENLHREFVQNRSILINCIEKNKLTQEYGFTVMNNIGLPKDRLLIQNMDSIVFNLFEHMMYFPSEHSLKGLIQSGKLQLISNNKLKELLHNWSRTFAIINEKFTDVDDKVDHYIVPYLTTRYPLKDMDAFGPLNWKQKSVLKIDKYQIFYDIAFENLIDDLMYKKNEFLEKLELQLKIIDQILIETKIEE